MAMNQPAMFSPKTSLVCTKLNSICLLFITISIGIEAQLLSQADIDRGINVNFPMKDSNISVQSEVPSSIISKNTSYVVRLIQPTLLL